MTRAEVMQLFAGVLTVLAMLGTLAGLALLVGSRRSAALAEMRARVAPSALPLAWLVATVATAGSLWFSEVEGYVPCTLCWYQRIGIYPLAVILAVASLRRDADVRWYVWPITAITAGISLYHWLYERLPIFDVGACSATVPCDVVWFTTFGFMTLAWMALVTVACIAVLMGLAAPPRHAGDEAGADTDAAEPAGSHPPLELSQER